MNQIDIIEKSSIVDLGSPTANMYGCEPCPKCGGKHRFVFWKINDVITCDDCSYEQKISRTIGVNCFLC